MNIHVWLQERARCFRLTAAIRIGWESIREEGVDDLYTLRAPPFFS